MLLAEYITLPEGLARAVSRGDDLTDAEISLSVKGAKQECLVSLRVIRGEQGLPQTYIATLRRIEQVRKLVTRLVWAQVRLTLDDAVRIQPARKQVELDQHLFVVRVDQAEGVAGKAMLLTMGGGSRLHPGRWRRPH